MNVREIIWINFIKFLLCIWYIYGIFIYLLFRLLIYLDLEFNKDLILGLVFE